MTLGVLAFWYAATLAVLPVDSTTLYGKSVYNTGIMSFQAEVELTAWDIGFIGGSWQNKFVKEADHLSFIPIEDLFVFRVGIRFEHIEIGYEHECDHPVVSSNGTTDIAYQYSAGIQGGHDKIYLTISNRDLRPK